jgi:hypothetical protein
MKAQSHLSRSIDLRDRNGQIIGAKEVVTYQGLLSKAHEEGLSQIRTSLLQIPSDENGRTAIAKAEVSTSKGLFEGLGDASPENVNSFIVPHLIRMAETRAKARAFRDAVNVGELSQEELEGTDASIDSFVNAPAAIPAPRQRVSRNGPESNSTAPARPNLGSSPSDEPMTEAQRRYLFRLVAGQGFQRQAAEERIKDLLQVGSLSEATKAQAMEAIDQLLQQSPQAGGSRSGTPPF